MGSGKTVVSLTAIDELLSEGVINRVLVLAPLKVCNAVWSCEHLQWEHLNDLTVTVATGAEAKRNQAMAGGGKVVVTNFENVEWIVNHKDFASFDGLLIDEATKLKGGGKTFKLLRKHIKKFKWRTAMTGTPVSENFQQLFYQMFVVDNGQSLGTNKDKFLWEHFIPADPNGYKWNIKPDGAADITRKIARYIHEIPDYQDALPPMTVRVAPSPLPPDARKIYDAMRKSMEAEGVTADSAAIQVMKLQQIASGFMYRDDDEDDTIQIHDAKLEALMRILKNGENGPSKVSEPTIVVYQFKEELSRLLAALPDAGVIGGGVPADQVADTIKRWNEKRLNVLLLHPKSAGHGLNLAAGGCRLVWFSPVWSRDLFDQTNARLWRRGQHKPVDIVQLIAPDTVEQIITARVDQKGAFMSAFKAHLAAIDA